MVSSRTRAGLEIRKTVRVDLEPSSKSKKGLEPNSSPGSTRARSLSTSSRVEPCQVYATLSVCISCSNNT
ncbi:unnamed protein product [Auanema sp. JU1783]|nr:unnamed protein product [Auanema sp. JU1783]